MSWLIWFATGEALIILALAAWAAHLLGQLDSERQRIALLRAAAVDPSRLAHLAGGLHGGSWLGW